MRAVLEEYRDSRCSGAISARAAVRDDEVGQGVPIHIGNSDSLRLRAGGVIDSLLKGSRGGVLPENGDLAVVTVGVEVDGDYIDQAVAIEISRGHARCHGAGAQIQRREELSGVGCIL